MIEVRYSPDKKGFKKLTTAGLRKSFLIDNLFIRNSIPMVYSDVDRSITGSAVPVGKSLKLIATKSEMSAEYFAQRRELGIINIGGKGTVIIDKKNYTMQNFDALYVGKGARNILFKSREAEKSGNVLFC